MDAGREDSMNLVVDLFTSMLLPFFSWCLCQLASATLGCKLTLVLRHPSKAFKQRVYHSWVEDNLEFSCAEILAFQTASGRRRSRKKLKKAMRPLFRQSAKSPECVYMRDQFEEIFGEIPPKAVAVYNIAEADKKVNEQFTPSNREDVLEMFPPDKTLGPSLIKPVFSELGEEEYWQAVQELLWEANYSWDSMLQIRKTRNSKIWSLLGIDPDEEPDIKAIIDKSLEFAQGKADADRLLNVARWVIRRMLALQFLQYPYSDKKPKSLETPTTDGLTLEGTIEDIRAQRPFSEIEAKLDLEILMSDLPASQRGVMNIYLEAEKTDTPVKQICERDGKDYEAVRQVFARIKKKYRS